MSIGGIELIRLRIVNAALNLQVPKVMELVVNYLIVITHCSSKISELDNITF